MSLARRFLLAIVFAALAIALWTYRADWCAGSNDGGRAFSGAVFPGWSGFVVLAVCMKLAAGALKWPTSRRIAYAIPIALALVGINEVVGIALARHAAVGRFAYLRAAYLHRDAMVVAFLGGLGHLLAVERARARREPTLPVARQIV